jgi:hypothetical protein
MSMFKKAAKSSHRLKMYIYGETGSGKTITSLHFPSPAVVDAERGTLFYGDQFNFEKIETKDPRVIAEAIDELLEDPQDFKTFVIDPWTEVDNTISTEHLRRMRVKKNNVTYSLQPLDYKAIKEERNLLITKLLALDMNVIVTARAKPQYSDEEGEFMKKIGLMPDGPKELPYLFDVVLELNIESDGTRTARVIKDRSNKLPERFPFSYESFVKYIGVEGLERAADASTQQITHDTTIGRHLEITFAGSKINTAGITEAQLTTLSNLVGVVGEGKVKEKLQQDYGVNSMFDLREDEANLFIEDLKNH